MGKLQPPMHEEENETIPRTETAWINPQWQTLPAAPFREMCPVRHSNHWQVREANKSNLDGIDMPILRDEVSFELWTML